MASILTSEKEHFSYLHPKQKRLLSDMRGEIKGLQQVTATLQTNSIGSVEYKPVSKGKNLYAFPFMSPPSKKEDLPIFSATCAIPFATDSHIAASKTTSGQQVTHANREPVQTCQLQASSVANDCGTGQSRLTPWPPSSAPTSPGGASDIWDSPQTPPSRAAKRAAVGYLTPCTPPTIYSVSVGHRSSSGSAQSIDAKPTTFQKIEAQYAQLSGVKTELKELIIEEDLFKPRKLFRGFTNDLQAMEHDNAKVAGSRFNTDVSFAFEFESIQSYSPQAVLISNKYDASTQVKVECIEQTLETTSLTSVHSGIQLILEHILPWELHARLTDDPHRCVASLVKDPYARCKNKATGSLEIVDGCFRDLLENNTRKNYLTLLRTIETLVKEVVCGSHVKAALTGPASEPRMLTLRSMVSDSSYPSNAKHCDVVSWLKAISKPKSRATSKQETSFRSDPEYRTSPANRMPHKPLAIITSTAATPVVPLSYALGFSPYLPKKHAGLPVHQHLFAEVTKPLGKNTKEGFIYAFWDKGHFGKVKIGRTDDLDQRLETWTIKCKREFTYHHSTYGGVPTKVLHCCRIERLIHIELKEYRKQRRCEACEQNHIEWFEVSEAHVGKVYQKWQSWVLQKPYALNHLSQRWELRPEMRRTLQEICKPVPFNEWQQKPRRKSAGANKGKTKKRT